MANEAAKLVGDDVATAEAIDTGMQLGAGFPEGTCRRADDIGLDTILEELRALSDEHSDDRYEPADYLVELVEAGHTGTEAGRGFHEYDTGDGLGDYHTSTGNSTTMACGSGTRPPVADERVANPSRTR